MTQPNSGAPDVPEVERIRDALIQAALDGYEQAGLSGLCEEGRWEAAISAMRRLDLTRSPTGGG
jgi:hypothetical protein